MDLLHEQTKILVGEVALRTSSLNRLSDQAARNPEDFHIRVSFPCETVPKLVAYNIVLFFMFALSAAGSNTETGR